MGSLIQTWPLALADAEVPISFLGLAGYFLLTLLCIAVFVYLAVKGLNTRVFRTLPSQLAEQLYLFIENMCVGIIGPGGRKYIPMIMTLWLLIFTGNFIALFAPASPTAILSFNLGMALTSVGYVQYEGIRANGLFGHMRHFAGPKLGGAMVLISCLLFVVEVISEIMKNVSLSLRLYGNIHGGHEAVQAMNGLLKNYFIPLGAFLLPIKLLTVVVQALIFTLLTCVYISLVTHHEEEDHEHAEALPAAA
jgi:F-type H+-transporting ATPase subunit a